MVCIRPHHITGELLDVRSRDYDSITRAYGIMTPEEIVMSERRVLEICQRENREYLKAIRGFDIASRETEQSPRRYTAQVA